MIKLSKKVSFFLILISGFGLVISLLNSDFEKTNKLQELILEASLPLVFLISGVNFMYIYINHLKKEGKFK